jgi:hypothetical protein
MTSRIPSQPLKEILSAHKSRETAARASKKAYEKAGERVWECHARVVWTDSRVHPKDLLAPKDFATWRPGEKISVGERYTDSD